MSEHVKKCIAFLRVSTHIQNIDSQKDEVINTIHRYGYTDDEILCIEQTESAIKLSIDERVSVQALFKAINEHKTIEYVFVYEISRLTRQARMMYEIRDFLIEHKVNLHCLKPEFTLLDKNFEISQTASILFSLFTSISESEMMIKKERLHRGVMHKKSLGLHYGGSIAVGYKTDKEDRYVIDEEGAEYVRRIFTDYVAGKSVRKIARDLQDEGWRTDTAYLTVVQSVLNILHREYYTGNDGVHPAIISQELYDQAQNKCKKARVYSVPKDEVMLLKGLIYDKKSGFLLSGNKANGCYYSKRVKGPTVSWVVIDPIIWTFVVLRHSYRFVYERQNWLNEVDNEIERNKKIIETMKDNIEKEREVIDRIEERYIEGKITKSKADELEAKHVSLVKGYKSTMKTAEEDITRLINDINTSETSLDYDNMSMSQRIELVRKCISKIIIERQTRFIVHLEIQMNWRSTWDMEINTREKKVLKVEERYNRYILMPPKI